MTRNTVVPKIEKFGEDEFQDLSASAISECVATHGREKTAKAMDVSTRQLSNIMSGSTPAAHRLYNLRTLNPDALDRIDREQNLRAVPRDAVCSSDPVSAKLAKLLSRTIEMEAPTSEGGVDATLAELLSLGEDEALLRETAHKLSGWIEQLDAYRAGQKPRLRKVAA